MLKTLRYIPSLGQLGLIMLLMAATVYLGASAASNTFSSFGEVWNTIDALELLENQASSHLNDMMGYESDFAFVQEYDPETSGDEPQQAAANLAEVQGILDELEAQGFFSAEASAVDEFRQVLDEHRVTFEQVVTAYDSGDLEEAATQMELAYDQIDQMQGTLAEMVADLDAAHFTAAQILSQEITRSIQMISLAVVIMILLALWGYRAASRLTRPLLDLANAVIAIGGDQYRPELLANVIRLGGPAGRLARALQAFAAAIEGRSAGQKEEIASLRQQLYEARRRRLKITRPEAEQ